MKDQINELKKMLYEAKKENIRLNESLAELTKRFEKLSNELKAIKSEYIV